MSGLPWLLFMPDGTWDGAIWSPASADEAGRKFFGRAASWAKHQREGWAIRRAEPGEHQRLLAERKAAK